GGGAARVWMNRLPVGRSEPAIHLLRAVTGLPGARNQVHGPPAAIACSGLSTAPGAITMWTPEAVAILPASIFVCMPPRERPEPAAPAMASTSDVIFATSGVRLASGFAAGGRS